MTTSASCGPTDAIHPEGAPVSVSLCLERPGRNVAGGSRAVVQCDVLDAFGIEEQYAVVEIGRPGTADAR